MLRKSIIFWAFFIALSSLTLADHCRAGFGASPPWVKNYNLLPGSYYEQKITLSRGDPEEDMEAKVIFKLPEEIKNWFSVDKGMKFPLPKGEMQVPVKIIVNVPTNARLDKYVGTINIEAVPVNRQIGVGVNLAAGIEVDLEVTDRQIEGMLVRYVSIDDVPQSSPISVLLRIQNTGNVKTRPDRVEIKVLDQFGKNILGTAETRDLDWILSFQTKDIFAKFPMKLPMGGYWAEIKIYKGNDILRETQLIFNVVEKKPILENPMVKKMIYAGAGILLMVFLVAAILIIRSARKKGKLRFSGIKIGKIEIRVIKEAEGKKENKEIK